MKPLTSLTRAWLIAAATCVLAACGGGDGGGGDTPSQPASSAYLGNWVRVGAEGCLPTGEVNPATGYQVYVRLTWTLTQGAGSDLHSRAQVDLYEDARCSRLLLTMQEEGNLRYVGQRVRNLGREEGTVDRYIYQWFNTTARDVTGATERLTSPYVWQSGQDISLHGDGSTLATFYDSQPGGYVDIFIH